MSFGKGIYKGTRLLAAFLILAGAALLLSSSDTPPFTQKDKAFYASDASVNFVRPGLVFKIQKVEIGADYVVKATFSMTDPKGLPLDRDGITTPGAVASSFILATIPNNNEFYQAYTTRVKTSTYPPTVGKTAKQASGDTGGRYDKVSDGVYVYTFGTKVPSTYEKTATHTVAVYGSRNLIEFDMGTNYATDVYSFVPSGAPVTHTRDFVLTSSCNRCHDDLNFHGGSRRGYPICDLCHTPAYNDVTNVNPETGNTIDMRVMTHKIHMGADLPSVQAGTPYQIVGFGNAVSDFSDVHFPAVGPNNCQMCHEPGGKQGDFWLTKPTRAACGACHDTVNFATGEGHVGLPQATDNLCSTCHIPVGEIDFDASIKGAHTLETESSLLSGISVKITSVENNKAGQKPIVNFTLTDKKGTVLDCAKINRCAVTLAATTADYGTAPLVGPTGYITETITSAKATGTGWQYAMNATIPATAKGTFTIAMEARVFETVLAGTLKEKTIEYGADNPQVFFSVDGSAVTPRREIVDLKKCNGCHYALSLHGTNRNQTEYCVVCHNPMTTDAGRRTPALMPAEGIDFALMIHRIHAGNLQTRDYTIYGFGNSANNYNEVTFPAPLTSCDMCHITDTWNVPTKASLSKVDPRGLINPVTPATAACTGCHTSVDAASHALANTTTLGESCGACHGSSSDFAVTKVHAQ
jgi:OmcA/MtrC family decaheme c-type cytochrome